MPCRSWSPSRGFEGVAALLWEGYAEGGGDEAAVRRGLAAARVRAFADVPKLLAATRGLNPVEALRVGIAMLPDNEPMPHHFLVCGAMPVFLAALLNADKGTGADRARSRRSRRRRISCA